MRARVRAELTREILNVAKQHLAIDGAAALSLRGVARDVGMVSSAIYRYFPSRDDLITALIIDGYEQIATTIAKADARVTSRDTSARWMAIGRAVRNGPSITLMNMGCSTGPRSPGTRHRRQPPCRSNKLQQR